MNLPWYEKTAINWGLGIAEQRSPQVKKIISELSSPALWACLATSVPLIAQLFTSIGNPHLAAIGGSIMAVYAIAVQLKDAFLHVPPPGADQSHTATSVAVTSAATATAAQTVQATAAHLQAMGSRVEDTLKAAEAAIAAIEGQKSKPVDTTHGSESDFVPNVPGGGGI